MLLDLSKPYNLILGDCLEVMPGIPTGSVDAIIADWPYGTTACPWDSVIPLEPLWKECKQVIKNNGAIVLTANQPFTTVLIASSPYFGTPKQWFRYCWIWKKNRTTGHGNANRMPMRNAEDICVFYRHLPTYNPQGLQPCRIDQRRKDKRYAGLRTIKEHGGIQTRTGYPKMIIEGISAEFKTVHPTQKPVALMEYLIKTYTNPGDLVLDNTMGSGSTGEACLRTGRRFIGIEKDEGYFEIAQNRLERVERELRGEQLEMVI